MSTDTKTLKTHHSQPNIPKLRFPEFKGEWEQKEIQGILERVGEPVNVQVDKEYREIGIRSHGRGLFHKDYVTGEALGNKRVFHVVPDCLVLNIVFAWEQALSITTNKELGFIASHRFPMLKPKKGEADIPFVFKFFMRPRGKWLLELASPGGAGRNKTLGQKDFAKTKITIPNLPEQQKIASFLTTVDQKIEKLQRKKDQLTAYKKGMMQKLFSQEIRFKDENGNDFPEWDAIDLSELLKYKQPTQYLVHNTEYSDDYDTPVLTAGKTFVLGYTNENEGIFKDELPCIIFDDFTTAHKFVDFSFKAKSSAMKILVGKNSSVCMSYVYNAMSQIEFHVGDHKRHWISEYQHNSIPYPSEKERNKITQYLTALDKKIVLTDKKLTKAQSFKKGLLQQMFV